MEWYFVAVQKITQEDESCFTLLSLLIQFKKEKIKNKKFTRSVGIQQV